MPTTDDTQQEKAARQLVERLRQAGHTAFWAGGCVRDKLLGRPPRDIDIATNAVPDSILEIFCDLFDVTWSRCALSLD